jgi:hypothetical protein
MTVWSFGGTPFGYCVVVARIRGGSLGLCRLDPTSSQWSDSFRDVCGRYRVEPLAAQWRSSLEVPFRVTFSYTR